jgi:hypothetical protein
MALDELCLGTRNHGYGRRVMQTRVNVGDIKHTLKTKSAWLCESDINQRLRLLERRMSRLAFGIVIVIVIFIIFLRISRNW